MNRSDDVLVEGVICNSVFQAINMNHTVLSVILVAFLLSTTFLHSAEGSYLRFGRTLSKRKLRARNRIQAETDDALASSKRQGTGIEQRDDAYLPRYNW